MAQIDATTQVCPLCLKTISAPFCCPDCDTQVRDLRDNLSMVRGSQPSPGLARTRDDLDRIGGQDDEEVYTRY